MKTEEELLDWIHRLEAAQKELKELIINQNNKVKRSENVMERITSFETACEDLNIKTHGDAFKLLKLKRTLLSEVAIEECDDVALKLIICIHGLNEGHIFNWKSTKELKYFPYFNMNSLGSGFFHSDADWSAAYCDVSSRLAFKSKELAIYGGKTFSHLYEEYMLQE